MQTNAECKNAICPAEKKRERLTCSGGLYLEICGGQVITDGLCGTFSGHCFSGIGQPANSSTFADKAMDCPL